MRIDSELKQFTETYDREALESIERFSDDPQWTVHADEMPLFQLKESFADFQKFLQGYKDYQLSLLEYKRPQQVIPRDTIKKKVKEYVEKQLFQPTGISYPEVSNFIKDYINGTNALIETVDQLKDTMLESGVDQEAIGDINEFVDEFMIKFHESFDPCMNDLLWASGYHRKKRFEEAAKRKTTKEVFV